MHAVDTSVLVRFLTANDAAQSAAAERLLTSGGVFIAKSVLLEAEWVLRSAYGRPRRELALVFQSIADAGEVVIEDEPSVRRAIAWFAAGLDFADALHLSSRREGVEFLTFDKGLVSASRRVGAAGVRKLA